MSEQQGACVQTGARSRSSIDQWDPSAAGSGLLVRPAPICSRASFVLFVVMVVDWMAYSATYISVPTMILREKCEDLGLSLGDECNSSKEAQAQQAAFMAMFSLCTGAPSVAVCSLLSHLSDVIGRKPMFLLGNLQGVLMYGVLLINGARGASTLILITFINLLGGIYVTDGAIFASVADLTSNSSGHDRVRLMSIIEGAQWFGQILGPLIGGHVSTLVSPQTSFIVPTALYGVGLLLSVVAYPETLSHERRATFDFQKSHPFGVVSIARGYRRSMILASGLLFAQWGLGTGVATWPMFTKNSFDWKNDQIGNMEALYFTANAMGLFVLLPIINRRATPKAVITASAACSIFMWGCHILVTAGWMMFPLACLGMFSAMLFPLIRAGIATEFGPSMYGAALGVAALVQQTAKVGVLPAVGLAWHVIQESGLPDYMAYVIVTLEYAAAFLIFLWVPIPAADGAGLLRRVSAGAAVDAVPAAASEVDMVGVESFPSLDASRRGSQVAASGADRPHSFPQARQ